MLPLDVSKFMSSIIMTSRHKTNFSTMLMSSVPCHMDVNLDDISETPVTFLLLEGCHPHVERLLLTLY